MSTRDTGRGREHCHSEAAQQPESVPRAIQLPDTMGANFDVADTLTATSAPTDFDFLIGIWRFTFQARQRNGAFTQPFTGHWVFSKKRTGDQGVLLEDHWRPGDASACEAKQSTSAERFIHEANPQGCARRIAIPGHAARCRRDYPHTEALVADSALA